MAGCRGVSEAGRGRSWWCGHDFGLPRMQWGIRGVGRGCVVQAGPEGLQWQQSILQVALCPSPRPPPHLPLSPARHTCSLNRACGVLPAVASCSYLDVAWTAPLLPGSELSESAIIRPAGWRPPGPSALPARGGSPAPHEEAPSHSFQWSFGFPGCVPFCQVPRLSGLSFPTYRIETVSAS